MSVITTHKLQQLYNHSLSYYIPNLYLLCTFVIPYFIILRENRSSFLLIGFIRLCRDYLSWPGMILREKRLAHKAISLAYFNRWYECVYVPVCFIILHGTVVAIYSSCHTTACGMCICLVACIMCHTGMQVHSHIITRHHSNRGCTKMLDNLIKSTIMARSRNHVLTK